MQEEKLTIEQEWLEGINAEAQEKADELSELLQSKIEPFVFVVESLKDAAIGFLKKPDARQSFKIMRAMGEDYDTGIELCARAQLVRDYNGTPASDSRFMDVNGKYAIENSELNLSLLIRCGKLVSVFKDEFKKK